MENRVAARMKQLLAIGGKSLSIVIMIADPDITTTFELVRIAMDEGVDVFEIGIPIGDPFLDSAVMRASMSRALAFSSEYDLYLETLGKLRATFPEAVFEVMIYHETVINIGFSKFFNALSDTNMDCVLVADAVFKGPEFLKTLDEGLLPKDIYPIRFVPHPFNLQQVDDLQQNARGFIIVQTKTDAQGRRDTVLEENKQTLKDIRQAGIQVPLVFAYGIKSPDDARRCISLGADGVLIGTVLLDAAHRLPRAEYRSILKGLRNAVAPL